MSKAYRRLTVGAFFCLAVGADQPFPEHIIHVSLPNAFDDVSVKLGVAKLFYSEAPDIGNEDLWKFCEIALSRFVLGVPA